MVTRSISSKYYDKEYFALCGGHREFFKGKISENLYYAYKLAKIKKGMEVLDIGAGRGELAVKCAQAGALVKAIDYSGAAIKIALDNLAVRAGKEVAQRVTFRKMNAKKITFPENSFEVVFMNDVVEHLYPEELKLAILEIRRVIRPGGRLIIHTPNVGLIRPVSFLAKILFRWDSPKQHVNEQSWFSLKNELKVLGENSRVFFRARRQYFSEPVRLIKGLPSWSASIAKILDTVWENKIISLVIYNTPLAYLLGTDLWAVVTVEKNR